VKLIRTRKVRRSVVDERYALLIDAIYRGQPRVRVETEVTFEDGRKGRTEAEMAIRDSDAQQMLPRAA
jgi:long-chain acyl-CoA synthetase